MTVRKILQEIIEKHPRFHNISPLKTKHVVHWCRCHGYTPPDPEALRNEEDSIEDVLTQIDSEPGEHLREASSSALYPQKTLPVKHPTSLSHFILQYIPEAIFTLLEWQKSEIRKA